METHNGQADQAEDHVEQDHRSSEVIFVTEPASAEHDHAREDIGRGYQTLRSPNAETHVLSENDREEVGEGVSDGGGVEEDQGESPNFQVQAPSKEAAQMEGLNLGITTIRIDPADNEGGLALGKESPGVVCLVREVYEKPVASNAKQARNEAFNDEDPSPSS